MTTRKITRAHNWARSFQRINNPLSILEVPPTVSILNTSTINSNTGGDCSHPWETSSDVLDYGLFTMSDYGDGKGIAAALTKTDSSIGAPPLTTISFLTDAPEFELVTGYSQFCDVNLIVDGQLAFTNTSHILPTSGGSQYLKYSFGSDTQEYELIDGRSVSTTGTGYNFGDILSIEGGTTVGGDKALVQVVNSSGSSVKMIHGGTYTAIPSGPAATSAVTGTGTGTTVTSLVWGKKSSNRKIRHIEIGYLQALRLQGINIDNLSRILPYRSPDTMPKVVFVGDSQSAGTYLRHAYDQIHTRIATKLGFRQRSGLLAVGGTGYVTSNGTNPGWASAERISDIVRLDPDIVIFIGSQNDSNNSTTRDAITSMLNTLSYELPDAIFVGIGPVRSTNGSFTKDGWDNVADQSRVRYIDNVTQNWLNTSGNSGATLESGTSNGDFYWSSDVQHLSGIGREYFADIAAPQIANAIISMVGLP